MSRLLWLLCLPLLLGAAPPQPTVEPPAPLLGRPCTVSVPLPDATTTLVGLPALGAFELLLPPQRDGAALRLLLLPLRPGIQTLPALPLLAQGAPLATAPLTVTVVDDLPAELTPAPLLAAPDAGDTRRSSWAWLLLLLLPAVAAGIWVRRKRPVSPPAPTCDEELAALARRLAACDPGSAAVQQLLAEITAGRFGPAGLTTAAATALLQRGRALLQESP